MSRDAGAGRWCRRVLPVALLLAGGAMAAASLPAPLQALFADLPEAERQRLLARQQRLEALPPPQREALERAVRDWDALTPAQQAPRREAWQAWSRLPADERARMQAARQRFEALPEDARRQLRVRFDALDAGLHRGWLLGPTLGADWPRLHPLFAQVPEERGEALLAALRELSPQGREDLAVLAQRTPPEERVALHEELLSQPPQERDGWLRGRVAPQAHDL